MSSESESASFSTDCWPARLHLLLDPLAQPLLDHALVVQITRPGDALDSRQHSRIKPQRDRRGLAVVRLVAAVPEPGSMALLFGGMLALLGGRRRSV